MVNQFASDIKLDKDSWKIESYSPNKKHKYYRYRCQSDTRKLIYIGNAKRRDEFIKKIENK